MKESILQTRFIEGTNQQYSIREDGVVVGHYRYDKWGNKLVKDRIFKGYKRTKNNSISIVFTLGSPQQQHSLRTLMETYFDIEGKPSNILGYKDNDNTNYKLSNLFYIQPKSKLEIGKKSNNKAVLNINKWYVASKLNIRVAELTDELYEHHKKTLLLKREIAKKLNVKTQSIK